MILRGKNFAEAEFQLKLRLWQLEEQARKGIVPNDRAEKFRNFYNQFCETGNVKIAEKAVQECGFQ